MYYLVGFWRFNWNCQYASFVAFVCILFLFLSVTYLALVCKICFFCLQHLLFLFSTYLPFISFICCFCLQHLLVLLATYFFCNIVCICLQHLSQKMCCFSLQHLLLLQILVCNIFCRCLQHFLPLFATFISFIYCNPCLCLQHLLPLLQMASENMQYGSHFAA